MKQRTTCIIIPSFSIHQAAGSAYSETPTVVLDEKSNVLAVNHEAAEFGVFHGMSSSQALSVCPDLVVTSQATEKENDAIEAIKKELHLTAPCVEIASDRNQGVLVVYIDSTGLERLHRGESKCAKLFLTVVKQLGYEATVGIADSKFAAKVAAETSAINCSTIVPHGNDRKFVENFSVEHLDLKTEARDTLRDLGINRIEDLSSIPTTEIAHRFGEDGRKVSAKSKALVKMPFNRRYPQESLTNEIFLTYRISRIEAIVRRFGLLAQQLFDKIRPQQTGCCQIDVGITHENHEKTSISLILTEPTLSVHKFSRQLQGQLEKTLLSSPVTGIKIEIPCTSLISTEQLSLNSLSEEYSSGNDQSSLSDKTVFLAKPCFSLLPEKCFNLTSYSHPKGNLKSNRQIKSTANHILWNDSRIPVRGLRLTKTPTALVVTVEEGVIASLQSRRTGFQGITSQEGPWDVSGGWWDDQFSRLYYRFRTHDYRNFLCYFDRLIGRWFLQGVYD